MGNCHSCRSCPPKAEESVEGDLIATLTIGDERPGPAPQVTQVEVVQQNAASEAQARAKRGAKATAAAIRVRTLADTAVKEAWNRLQGEFEVQKMVWDSVGLGRGPRHQGAVAMLQSKVDFAIVTRKLDPENAMAALQAALERSIGETGLLNRSMETALQECILVQTLVGPRRQLASLLEGELGPISEVPSDQIQGLLSSCDLDAKLKEAVQKVLAPKG